MTVGIGLLGATSAAVIAEVGQRAFARLGGHPTLEIRALVADDPDDVGKRFGDVCEERWLLPDESPPEAWMDATLVGIESDALRDAGVDLVVSGLPAPRSKELEPLVAAAGVPVVSGSMGLRMDPDVPLVVAGVNPKHLDLIEVQRKSRGTSGFVVNGPLCTAAIAALVCKPIDDAFGVSHLIATTMQAVSGSGLTGLPAMKILDNVLPYINGEEEKLAKEFTKILGHIENGAVAPFTGQVSSTCTRVHVRHGHTIALTLGLRDPASPADIADVLTAFTDENAGPASPLTPPHPLYVHTADDRPQPLLDRDRDGGRVVSVGRIRSIDALPNGIGLVGVGHNHERGTWGNVFMLSELLVAKGLVG